MLDRISFDRLVEEKFQEELGKRYPNMNSDEIPISQKNRLRRQIRKELTNAS